MSNMVNRKVLSWYEQLKSRTVDLVGDYAGDELFIIDGDSLLLHAFSDEKLDLNPGFQLLHATYIVENFLRELYQRKCNFHIVFFENQTHLCIPPGLPADLHNRCCLAREAIIQHLQTNVAATAPSIEVKEFGSYREPGFMDYLTASGTYFFMCHDGTFPGVESGSDSEALSVDEDYLSDETSEESYNEDNLDSDSEDSASQISLEDAHAFGFRTIINWFVCHGYNIALLNALECRDTKVMAMILEGSAVIAQKASDETFLTSSTQVGSWDMDYIEDEERDADLGLNNGSGEDADISFTSTQKSDGFENANGSAKSDVSKVDGIPHLESPWDEPILQEVQEILKTSQYPAISQRDLVVVVTLSLMYRSRVLEKEDDEISQAMLLHTAILHECRLSDRAVTAGSNTGESFLVYFTQQARSLLISDSWRTTAASCSASCDLADMIDGRLFSCVLSHGVKQDMFSTSVIAKLDALATWIKLLCGIEIKHELLNTGTKNGKPTILQRGKEIKKTGKATKKEAPRPVLPFSHSVFDAHLTPVHLSIDENNTQSVGKKTSRIFLELSHWHNHRRPVGSKNINPAMTAKQAFFANRRNQFFMAEMADYAASLTNATGGVLQPETVFVRSGKVEKQGKQTGGPKPIVVGRSKANEKKGLASGGPPSVKDRAVAANEKKQKELAEKQLLAWGQMKAMFDKESNLETRFNNVKKYLASRPTDNRVILQAEVSTYLLGILVQLWVARCAAGERDRSLHIAAFIWDMICRIAKMKEGMTPEIAACIMETVKALRLPDIELAVQPSRKPSQMATPFSLLESGKKGALDIGLSPTEFQLTHAAPFFDRNMGSAPDSRVRDFEPDEWQRKVLDEIDANRSLFVVAPTSAGKTFISFYAMKKILEGDDDGVLVYVAPTKALVNQVAAEIQARFSKSFKHGGKSVWGIHTRDYRINNPTGCQVLVTVPHILQIMLLAPANANSWSSRVKQIIFDEIHCIGQVDDGVVWEQLLLLAPCPIIALSATVGNPKEFSKWLGTTQKANGIDLTMIEHHHRYSDLRKYVYKPPQKFHFNGLSDAAPFPQTGLDNALGMAFMHPVACVVDRARGMPSDLSFEARDCWMLWNAMAKYQTPAFPVEKSLDPKIALPGIIRKVDVVEWEAGLKALLKRWIEDPKSPYGLVLEELERSTIDMCRPKIQISSRKAKESAPPRHIPSDNYIATALPLICSLHEQGALPALFFNYDRSGCEAICNSLLVQLEEAEEAWKKSSPAWKDKIAGWEAWKISQKKLAKKSATTDAKKKGKQGNDNTSKEDRMYGSTTAEPNFYESFDPEAPVEGFHLADAKKLTPSEFEEHAKELRRRYVPEHLITALRRGIGVHHAGMNRKYRQVCEILFRRGYLRVVIATGTLALGINMPCKTVVFSGDSIFLTALNFRQAAGRAGRRGFDVLGNVVFQGLPYSKICRLLSSRLPDLHGHFPVTTSLVLRLFTLLHESKQAPNAVRMINSLLSCPHIYLGGGEARDTVLHHLRFSIEFLRRSHLLDRKGAPLNFAGCVSHLYFVENSSFAFHALLQGGYFHGLCRNNNQSRKQQLRTLMLVLSHLFGRIYLRPAVLENYKETLKKSTSLVVLPPLPNTAAKLLHRNNEEILKIYSAYVKTFVDQHVTEPDCNLPLTGLKCGGNAPLEIKGGKSRPVRYTSAFYALSGHRDEWDNISDLCKTVRSGVWLEKAVVPYVGLYPEEGKVPLNAYLYDFFKHGNVHAIQKDNSIRKGDIWFLLNDFSMVLATIVTSLENFLKLSPGTDADTLDVMGSGEMHEGEVDVAVLQEDDGVIGLDKLIGSRIMDSKMNQAKSAPTSSPAHTAAARKRKVVDSWEDEEVESSGGEDEASEAEDAIDDGNPGAVWDGKDAGILNVLKGFKLLQADFDQKFREMWA